MNDYLKALDRNNTELARTIRETHAVDFAIVEGGLDHIIQGLNEFGEFRGKPKGDLESVRLFLATRMFTSLRMALLALELANYQQAATMVRMAMESNLVAEDSTEHEPTRRALLHGEGKMGKGLLTFSEMAGRLSPSSRETWHSEYGIISEYAAHPRMMGMVAMVTWDEENRPHLGLGGRYSELDISIVMGFLIPELRSLFALAFELTRDYGAAWANNAYQARLELDPLLERIEWRMKELALE